MKMLNEYPVTTVLSVVGIVIGFLVPFVFLLALIPELYLVTRPDKEVKQNGAFLLGATIILFFVMWIFYMSFYFY
jgi:hypothetical protein